jgi:peptidoglycan/LPS O-acetylase OafA/YrhL
MRLDHRVPELDGVRAIAISMVLLAHAFFGYPNAPGALASVPSPILQAIGHGWLGVDLFFMLSGFLITGILLDTRERPHYFKNFYARRVLRIMPLYFSVIFIWAILYSHYRSYFLLSSVFGANLDDLLRIPEPHGPGVLWSLAVEEHFYLVWPAVVLLLSRRALLTVSATIFVLSPILRGIFAARGLSPDLIYMLSWFRLDGLAAGALIAIWVRSSYADRKVACRIAAALVAAMAVMTVSGARFGLLQSHTPVSLGLRYTQAYLGFGALFVLTVAYRGTVWTAPLRWRVMQLIGTLSYCLYLIHLSIGDGYEFLVRKYSASAVSTLGPTGAVVARAVVMIGVSVAIALLSRVFLEQPFLALKDRFSSGARRTSRATPVLGVSAAP